MEEERELETADMECEASSNPRIHGLTGSRTLGCASPPRALRTHTTSTAAYDVWQPLSKSDRLHTLAPWLCD
jgi:hypothetical protein